MAIISATELHAALRINAGQDTDTVARLYAMALATVNKEAEHAPDAVKSEAIKRLAGHLYEMRDAPQAPTNPFRNSGAQSLLRQWVRRGVVSTSTDEASTASTASGVDAVARADAEAARDAARTAQSEVDALETRVDGIREVTRDAAQAGQVLTAINSRENPTYDWRDAPSAGTVADGSITEVKLADDAVTSRKIASRAITSGLLAANSVTGSKIPSNTITTAHIAADAVGGAEIAGDAVGTAELADNTITEPKLTQAVRDKLNASRTGEAGPFRAVLATLDVAAIARDVAGERDGDLVIGYDASTVAVFRYAEPPTNAWARLVTWQRGGRTDEQLETFIENIVSTWAISGNADNIPGSKTFDGLFKSEAQTPIPAANVTVAFDVGSNADANEVDETDAANTSFNISEQQANQSGAFIRCEYNLTRTAAEGALPRDIELILQNATTGATITRHNLKDEGAGHAQFAFGDAGSKRWAVRCVTTGRYAGNLAITNTDYHAAEALAESAVKGFIAPEIHDEVEKRQAEDRRLTSEIARVEAIKAIVNGLPAATVSRKTSIIWKTTPPYEQAVSDAFQVPATGFVQFVLGNLGATPIMRAEDCINREMTGIYTFGRDNVGLEFDSSRRAIVIANRGGARSPLADDIGATTTGYLMLHWAPARASETGGGSGGGFDYTLLGDATITTLSGTTELTYVSSYTAEENTAISEALSTGSDYKAIVANIEDGTDNFTAFIPLVRLLTADHQFVAGSMAGSPIRVYRRPASSTSASVVQITDTAANLPGINGKTIKLYGVS